MHDRITQLCNIHITNYVDGDSNDVRPFQRSEIAQSFVVHHGLAAVHTSAVDHSVADNNVFISQGDVIYRAPCRLTLGNIYHSCENACRVRVFNSVQLSRMVEEVRDNVTLHYIKSFCSRPKGVIA